MFPLELLNNIVLRNQSDFLLNGEDVQTVTVLISDVVHGLLNHIDSQAADFAVLKLLGDIRILLLKRIERYSAVYE